MDNKGAIASRGRGSSWSSRLRVPLAVLEVGLLVGVPIGILWAGIEMREFLGAGPARFYLDVAVPRIRVAVPTVLLVLAVYLLSFSAARALVSGKRLRSALATAVALAPLALFAAWRLNRDYLPGKFEVQSILANAAMAASFLLGCTVLSHGLLAWRRARLDGARGPRVLGTMMLIGAILILDAGLAATRQQTGPNVIILLVDALRADHLSAHGYDRPTSPNIDRFAEDAVLFTQAISPSTFTKTSVASLFTGLDPHRHGVYKGRGAVTDVLGPEHRTLAEVLQSHGLLTVAWQSNDHISGFMGFDQGFAKYTNQAGRIWRINEDFLSWLSRVAKASPFFAYLHYIDLHTPYNPRPPFDTMYGSYSNLYERLGLYDDGWIMMFSSIDEGEDILSAADVQQLKASYDGELTFMDGEIGSLLEALKAEGLYDNSYIVLTSDHGEGFMEHGFVSHSKAPYEELIHVPLIVKFPASRYAGRRIDGQVRLIDIAPTLLDYVVADSRTAEGGVSLRPLLEPGDAETSFPTYAIVETGSAVGIRTERWKLIEFLDGRWEFYDLANDPGEQNDLAPSEPKEAEPLRARARAALAERARTAVKSVPLDEKTIERLRALGYIQ